MNLARKTVAVAIILSFFAFASRAAAQDTMQHTFESTLYGGAIGGLIGTAVMLLTDQPGDHLGYILTGAGIGMLGGAAYGLASSGVVQSISEVEDGKFTLKMPRIKRTERYDKHVAKKEVINTVDLFSYKF